MHDQPKHPALVTPITELLGIRHPVLLAPMGDTAGGHLARAVSEAGGLGMIGGGYADPAWLSQALADAGDARVGVGFITFALAERPEALDVALAAEVPVIQLSFGDPRPFAGQIHTRGAVLVCQVQTSEELEAAVEAGADVIVAQGQDSGGHGRSGRATMGLVPATVDRVAPTPVVAAGGIADGRGLAAALMLGAAGVSLGTRFLASHEAITTRAELDAVVTGRSEDTVRTRVIDLVRGPEWPPGYDGRTLRNDLVNRWHDDLAGLTARRDQLHADYHASAPDDHSQRAVWAGEGLDLIDAVEPAGLIVERIVAEAVTALRGAGDLLTDDAAPL